MARPVIQRAPSPHYSLGKQLPMGMQPKDVTLWEGSAGLNYREQLFDTPKEQPAHGRNWRLDRGSWIQRDGTTKLGPGVNLPTIAAFGYTISNGTQYIIRVTTTTISIYNGGSDTWVDATGPAIAGFTSSTYITFSGWADKVMINGSGDKLYQLDPVAGTYVLITTTGHTNAQAVTTFAGRAILTAADFPYRISWSVKNDNTNWTGTGSGFEDLFSTPGGNADAALGVYPVTDEQAIVVRARTVWLMSTTGLADAPFRFSRIYDKIACDSPRAIVIVPGGICVPALDDIYYITPNAIQALGADIRPQYINNLFNPKLSLGVYDELRGQFVLHVQEGLTPLYVNWRYDFSAKAWSRDEYTFYIQYLGYVRGQVGAGTGTYDQLTGTIGGLTGTFDNLGTGTLSPAISSIIITTIASGGAQAGFGFVLREDPSKTTDWGADLQTATDSPTELRSGLLTTEEPDAALSRIMINDVHLYYLGQTVTPMNVEWSADGGTTWATFSAGNSIPSTVTPDTYRFTGTIEAVQIQIRILTTKLTQLRIDGLHVFCTQGARQSP